MLVCHWIDFSFVESHGWRFWVDFFTVLAGALSLLAIVVALGARTEATNQLRKERQLDFQIDAALYLLDSLDNFTRHKSRLRMFTRDQLPIARWAARVDAEWPAGHGGQPIDTNNDGSRMEHQMPVADGAPERSVRFAVNDELEGLIASLLDSR